jgi:hypothetical protein
MSHVDILRSDVFHVHPEENKNPLWRQLSKEEREQKVLFYLEQLSASTGKKVAPETIESLVQTIREGKLLLKKEVEYDRTNQRVVKLYMLTTEDHTPFYYYRKENANKKKNVKAMLLRKKV